MNAVNNIYDMAGNIYEWTSEVDSTRYRVTRGYSYMSGDEYSFAGRRGKDNSSFLHDYYGSRLTLYL